MLIFLLGLSINDHKTKISSRPSFNIVFKLILLLSALDHLCIQVNECGQGRLRGGAGNGVNAPPVFS